MQIESIRHKALRRFAETGQPKGLPADSVDRLRRMLAYIDAIEAAEELRVPPNFGAHLLTGDRKGEWSLFVTEEQPHGRHAPNMSERLLADDVLHQRCRRH